MSLRVRSVPSDPPATSYDARVTLDDLLAREGIRDVVARYNSYGDAGKFDRLWDLFADDAVMEVSPARGERATHTGLEEIKRIFTGAQDRVQAQVESAAPTYIRHFTATHQIDLVDADHATGRCYFAVIIGGGSGRGGLDHWGRYIDEYVRLDGTWRFQRRRVDVEGSIESSWFAS
jgi:3-phenylpropionate/cinnamic acid dioxygenase small subunit